MLAYLDAAVDRTHREVDVRFRDQVEAVRLGYVFAHDVRSLALWRRSHPQRQARNAPSDDVIMAQIARLANLYPGHVVRGTMP